MTETHHSDKDLAVDERESDAELRLEWRGKSNDREPGRFMMPLLEGALKKCAEGQRQLVLDFSELEYMNSSSFTPIVKLLDEAAKGRHRVLIEYSAARKWQSLSFTAMQAFATSDGRIMVRAK